MEKEEKLFGKARWNTDDLNNEIISEIIAKDEEVAIELASIATVSEKMQLLVTKYDEKVFEIISRKYREEVISEKSHWGSLYVRCKQQAKDEYNKRMGDPNAFDRLDPNQQEAEIQKIRQKMNKEKIDAISKADVEAAVKIANKTISTINELSNEGAFIEGYTRSRVLLEITSKVDQRDYLKEEYIQEWLSEFLGKDNFDSKGEILPEKLNPDGTINMVVYVFQNGDVGANNFMKFGAIGAGDGMFCLSSSRYEELKHLDPPIFNESGQCVDIPRLSEALGGVPLGSNPIAIKITVKVNPMTLEGIKSSSGGLGTAYFGEFCPGFKTQGGVYEAIIDSRAYMVDGKLNPDVELISHSIYFSTDELRLATSKFEESVTEFYDGMSKEDKKFFGIDKRATLVSKLSIDDELLKKFQDSVRKREATDIEAIAQILPKLSGKKESVELSEESPKKM